MLGLQSSCTLGQPGRTWYRIPTIWPRFRSSQQCSTLPTPIGNHGGTTFPSPRAMSRDKVVIPHAKRKHFPLVYFEFTKRIGRHPKVLYSDLGSEMTSTAFERYLLVKGVKHITVPRGEHHSIGVAEKAIQDLKNMMRCFIADSNVPAIYWD